MAQLTFDGDYKRARALMEQERPSHVGEGLLQGGKYMGRGLLEGFSGVLVQPVPRLRYPYSRVHHYIWSESLTGRPRPSAVGPRRSGVLEAPA